MTWAATFAPSTWGSGVGSNSDSDSDATFELDPSAGAGAAPSTSSSSSSSDAASPSSAMLNQATTVKVDNDYCAYNATEVASSGCKRPRNCRQCMQTTGCMVDTTGTCVSVSKDDRYDATLDFRLATLSDVEVAENLTISMSANASAANVSEAQHWLFPATAVKYCDNEDETCELCRATLFPLMDNDSRFCVSDSGCICVAMCDSMAAMDRIRRNTHCDADEDPVSDAAGMALIVASLIAIVVCVSIYWSCYRHSLAQQAREEELERAAQKSSVAAKSSVGDLPVLELSSPHSNHNTQISLTEASTISWGPLPPEIARR